MNSRRGYHNLIIISPLSAYFTIAIGVVVLLFGWALNIDFFKNLFPGFASMKPWTAINFIFCGAALILLVLPQNKALAYSPGTKIARLLASIPLLLGLMIMTEYLIGVDFGIDALLFKNLLSGAATTESNPVPGRMSPATSFNFVLLSIALISLSFEKPDRKFYLSQWLAITTLLIAGITLIAYAYNVESVYKFYPLFSVALHTAITFFVLSIGVLLAPGLRGVTAIFSAESAGGLLVRRLVPMALLMPFILGWLRLKGQQFGYYETEFGLALFASSNIVVFLILIWWTAWSLDRLDQKRKSAEINSARLVSIIEYSDDAIIGEQLDGTITTWNRGAEDLFGYAAEEAVGQNIRMLYPPEMLTEENILRDKIRRGEKDNYDDVVRIRKDGERIQIALTASPIRDETGRVIAISKIARDISRAKASEAEIKRVQKENTTILESITDALVTVDHEWRFIRINHQAEELLGQPAEKLLGKSLPEMYPQFATSSFGEAFRNSVKMGVSQYFEDYSKGLGLWLSCLIYPSEIGLSIYFRNITARKKLEEALQLNLKKVQATGEELQAQNAELQVSRQNLERERLRFKELFEFAPGGYLVTDVKGLIEQSNIAARALLLVDRRYLAGRLIANFVAADAGDDNAKQFAELLLPWNNAKEVRHAELKLKSSRREFIAAISVAPVFDYDGKLESLRWLMRDITESKRIENSLRETEGKLRLFVENAPAAVAMFDLQMKYLVASQHWLQDFALDGNIIGRSHYEVFPDLPDAWKEIHRRVLAGAIEKSEQDQFFRADGSAGWIKWEMRPWYDHADKIGGVIIFSEDITERIQSERELQESEEKFRTLFASIDEGVTLIKGIYDESGQLIDWSHLAINPGYIRQTGHADAIGKTARELYPNLEQSWIDTYARVIETGEPTRVENYLKDTKQWFSIFAARVGSAESRQIAIVFDDITERKRAERNLAFLSNFTERLIQASTSHEIVQLFGEMAGDYVGASVCPFIEVNREKNKSVIFDEWRSEEKYSIIGSYLSSEWVTDEYRQRMATGEPVPIRDVKNNSCVSNADNFATINVGAFLSIPLARSDKWIFSLGIYHEHPYDWQDDEIVVMSEAATRIWNKLERLRAEEDLRHLNETLEQKVDERTTALNAVNKELESFSYSVSHDLRAPLRAMDGFSLALLEDYGDNLDATGRNYLSRVRNASQHMAHLIDDMLLLARVTRSEVVKKEVNLSDLARSIAEKLEERDARENVRFKIEETVSAVGDERLLKIALENLLGNAYKFTSKKPDGIISFGQIQNEGRTEFYVKDNGAGFDMTYAGKLFGAFQRLHSAQEFEGTGIGLATVQRVIRKHGGEIRAEGVPGEGACFYFTI